MIISVLKSEKKDAFRRVENEDGTVDFIKRNDKKNIVIKKFKHISIDSVQ